MVNYLLQITADLENLTDLQPQGGCDDPNFSYLFKLKCGRCGELSAKETCVALNESVPLPVGKGTTHLIQKCKFCGRDGTVTMIPGRGKPLTQETSESRKFAPLMLFDCRGYELVDYVFAGGWKAVSPSLSQPEARAVVEGQRTTPANSRHSCIPNPPLTVDLSSETTCHSFPPTSTSKSGNMRKEPRNLLMGTPFDDIDLSGGEYAEYDEKGECPVMISNLQATFNVVK